MRHLCSRTVTSWNKDDASVCGLRGDAANPAYTCEPQLTKLEDFTVDASPAKLLQSDLHFAVLCDWGDKYYALRF